MQSEVPSQSFRLGRVSTTISVRADPSKIRDPAALRFAGGVWWSGRKETSTVSANNRHSLKSSTGLLVQAVNHEAANRQSTNNFEPTRRSSPRRHDPLFGPETAFGVPALPRTGPGDSR